MRITLTIILLLSFHSPRLFAQVRAITAQGDSILVYPNGTWKPITKSEASNIRDIVTTVKAKTEIDQFSKVKKITTESWNRFGKSDGNTFVSGYIKLANEVPAFFISLNGDLGCLSQNRSTMLVKLSNDEVIELIQLTKTDCSGNPSAGFIPISRKDSKLANYKDIIQENIDKLISFNWATIRIDGTDYYVDVTPNATKKVPKPNEFFKQHLAAVIDK